MAEMTLITFSTSHFCEKARWALDWHGVPYREICWAPGAHQILAKRCGAKRSSVPILLGGSEVVQGSSEIVAWAEANFAERAASLAPAGGALMEAEAVERRVNDILGPHVRRLSLAETLPAHANLLRQSMLEPTEGWHRLAGHLLWPASWRIMRRIYDAGPDAAAESRAIMEMELDWLDATLADGRPYLVGGRFSRIDLTVASLLAPFAKPAEMPIFHTMQTPDALERDVRRWSERPTMRFVREQYRKHRGRPAARSG